MSRKTEIPEIVISGISGRFPSSDSVYEFKENLYKGIDMVTADDSRWPVGLWGLPPSNGKVKSFDKFDSDFFGYNPNQVDYIDPQDRKLLEVVYEAILDAGINPRLLKGSNTGVFQGSCFQEYHKDFRDSSSTSKYLPNQVTTISRHFDFKGPLVHIDTACGSSFCALNEAFVALTRGVCDQAIVTGANSVFQPIFSYEMLDLKMISKDGKSKCMDSSANGYARAEAVVAVFLQKRRDSKRIYATILNSKTNADGWKPEGVTFPGIDGQAKLLKATYDDIGLNPLDFPYIEAHTTGTTVGDPVELNAIHKVLCCNGTGSHERSTPLLVGCIKSNIGHSEGASGLCALIKSIFVLQTKLIPANLHLKSPNMSINGLVDGSMKPVTETMFFDGDTIPVNCFGFGGSNVHVVIKSHEEMRSPESYNVCIPFPRLINICGRTKDSVTHIINYLKEHRSDLTKEFLYLLNQFSNSSFHDFPYRSYVIIPSKHSDFITENPIFVDTETVINIYFPGMESDFSSFMDLLQIPAFSMKMKIIQEVTSGMGIDVNAFLKKIIRTKLEDTILTLAMQICLIDVIKAVNLNIGSFTGSSIGELTCGYYDGALTLEQVFVCAVAYGSLKSSRNYMYACFKKLIPSLHPRERSSRWISDGSVYVTPEYFVAHLLKPQAGYQKFQRLNSVVEISCKGLKFVRKSSKKDASLLTMETLGCLYTKGCPYTLEHLYPFVKLPLPTWVPSLSPLIKWNHDVTWNLSSRLIELNRTNSAVLSTSIPFTFDKSNPEDSFLFDHKIDGRILFPASGYLAMVWFAFSKMVQIPFFDCPVRFEQVSIERATVLSLSKPTSFIVRMNTDTGSFVVKDGNSIVFKGKIFLASNTDNQLKERLERCNDPCVTILQSNDIYKEFRIRGYDYDQFFQGLRSCHSNGREGHVIWRDVLNSSSKDALNRDSDDDRIMFWLRSWILLTDSMIQLTLFDDRDIGRALKVPTKLQTLICCPRQLFHHINNNGTPFSDPLTLSTSKLIKCRYDYQEDVITTSGMIMKGLHVSLLKRTAQNPTTQVYRFIPFDEIDTFDDYRHELDRSYVTDYFTDCIEISNSMITQSPLKSSIRTSDISSPNHSLLRLLLSKLNDVSSGEILEDLQHDILIGKHENDAYYPDRFIKPFFDLVTYNLYPSTSVLKVTEVTCSSTFNLYNKLSHLMDESLLSDKLPMDYKAHVSSESSIPESHLIICRDVGNENTDEQVLQRISESIVDGGFFLVVTNQTNTTGVIAQALKQLDVSVQVRNLFETPDVLIKYGMIKIGQKTLLSDVLPLTITLFRKSKKYSIEDVILYVDLCNYANWLDQLKELLKSGCDKRIWLIPSVENRLKHSQVTGLVGFVKSLRLEPGCEQVRCLIDWSIKTEVSLDMYEDVVKKDLIINIRNDQRGWGCYEHISISDSQDTRIKSNTIKDYYLRCLKPGDLSSLVWTESNEFDELQDKKVNVMYASLNFKDVMYATGRLPLDSIQDIDPIIAEDSLLGMEFSGLDTNNNRVMGVLPYKALSTEVILSEDSFLIPIPDHWTLEEASTVPVVYSTAFYGLIVKGNLKHGESVLIHCGAGGVGMAAINICLGMKCEIYVTVGTEEKRKFLLDQFPELEEDHIFNSRDTKFEERILRSSDGRGVDIVLNSLSGEKMKASLRCLSSNGRFIEIGKVDLLQDASLLLNEIGSNITIHGVYPETFFQFNFKRHHHLPSRMRDEKNYLRHLIIQGMANGVVKPLKRTIFDMDRIEDAFRFMSSGKHIGKVVIKMKTSENVLETRQCQRRTYFCPNKSYVVVGGLGGFGLELIKWMSERGAKIFIINSRRGIREPYQQYVIDRLQDIEVKIVVSQHDSATEHGVQSLVKLSEEYAPIGGIFNTAAVFDDMLFEDQTVHTFDQVCAPKLKATFYLDKVTRNSNFNVDFFVAFSSISGGRGNPGQTSYNFANSVIDTICESRVNDGLHGLSIQWGVVGDVGYVANKSNSNNTIILGLSAQRIHSCLSCLDKFLSSPDPVVCCYIKSEKDESLNNRMDSTDVLKVVSRILGLKDIQSMDPDTTLGSLGIDSLIAVEIQQILEKIKGSQFPLKLVKELTLSQIISMTSSNSELQNSAA